MNTIASPSKGSRFALTSEILMLLLLVASLVQIGGCLGASRLLVDHPGSAISGPSLGTNAPAVGGSQLPPARKSAGFQFKASRG